MSGKGPDMLRLIHNSEHFLIFLELVLYAGKREDGRMQANLRSLVQFHYTEMDRYQKNIIPL